jgi:hypothetical protein
VKSIPSKGQSPVKKNIFLLVFFLYLLATSADLISIEIYEFQLKLPHVIGFLIFTIFLCCKKIVIEKKLFFCFFLILSSMIISSLKSVVIFRSLTYSLICFFSFCVYFLIPFNFMWFSEENKILKYYVISFFIIGSYAFMQFFFSIFGVILPFTTQEIILARGSAFALEPSFYALYSIPFIVFLNSKSLFLNSIQAEKTYDSLQFSASSRKWKNRFLLFFANLFLLISTTTTAMVSYFVFFLVLFFFPRYPFLSPCFSALRKKLWKIASIFASIFLLSSIVFFELFKKTFLKFFYVGTIHESFFIRFSGIFSAIQAFAENLFFGVGIGGIGPYLAEQYGINVPLIDFFDQKSLEEREIAHLFSFEPTNVFSEILGSLGIYGLFSFCLFLIVSWKQFKSLLSHEKILLEEKTNVLALLISLIVSLACLQINQGLFRSYIWVHIGISLGYVMKIKAKIATR